jgi:thiopeptide-type bacteriocin biosynthesis protein
MKNMDTASKNHYYFLPELFLRAPHYGFNGYDLMRLSEVLKQLDFQNAIWLASPVFFKILARKDFEYGRLNDKEKFTVHKYYNRICFRPTPFGSFSSFSLLKWGNGEPIVLADHKDTEIHVLPDQQILASLNRDRIPNSDTDDLILNPCLYRIDKEYRLIHGAFSDGKRYQFEIKALEALKFHIDLVELFKEGTIKRGHLLSWIEVEGACTAKEANDYLHFLLEEQVLMSRAQGLLIYNTYELVAPSETSSDAFWGGRQVIAVPGPTALPTLAARLISSSELAWDADDSRQPFYAALGKPVTSGSRAKTEQLELGQAVSLLRRLAVPRQYEDLRRFINDFRKRFDREKVPLLLALDPDAGISYGGLNAGITERGMLENIDFSTEKNGDLTVGWSGVHRMLFRRWIGDKLRDPWSPLEISKEDLADLQSNAPESSNFPQTLAVLYRKTAEHLLIEQAAGVAATSLIGRFSCFNQEVHRLCCDLAEKEIGANPDVVFADIGQLSDIHVDNINRRLRIYPFEIPLNVFSAMPPEQQINPGDLLLSVQGEELVLESARLGKRVIPRLATAFNFRHNHSAVFRLLSDLQFQGLSTGLTIELDALFPGLDFYPRITYQNTILSLAKWNLGKEQIAQLIELTPEELPAGLQKFRKEYRIPRYVSLGKYDQQLVFDLADHLESDFFIKCLKGLQSAELREYLLPDRSIRNGNELFAGQLVAFLVHDDLIYRPLVQVVPDMAGPRTFMVGSKWLYLKIYCTPRMANAILTDIVRPFIAENRALIDKWFFIRYHDQGHHLRLRFCAAEGNLGTLLVGFRKRMSLNGYDHLIHDYYLDTYRQEIERYSASLMPLVEDVFNAGSEMVIWFLRQRSLRRQWSEFEFGLITANLIIRCLMTDHEKRLSYIREATGGFYIEFGGGKKLKNQMDQKYRELRSTVEMAMRNTIMARRSTVLRKNLRRLIMAVSDPAAIQPLAADLIHMQMNRTFQSDQRKQEYLVYYCLEKYMISTSAQASTSNNR